MISHTCPDSSRASPMEPPRFCVGGGVVLLRSEPDSVQNSRMLATGSPEHRTKNQEVEPHCADGNAGRDLSLWKLWATEVISAGYRGQPGSTLDGRRMASLWFYEPGGSNQSLWIMNRLRYACSVERGALNPVHTQVRRRKRFQWKPAGRTLRQPSQVVFEFWVRAGTPPRKIGKRPGTLREQPFFYC